MCWDCKGDDWKKRDEVRRVLDLLQLESEATAEEVMALYRRVYGSRPATPSFRKTSRKDRIATAFAVLHTLCKRGWPRPTQYVARLCGLDCEKSLANVTRALGLDRTEALELARSRPQDYIDPVCAHLRIPFHSAGEIRRIAERNEWVHFGHTSTVIATASIYAGLLGNSSAADDEIRAERLTREACTMLDCSAPWALSLGKRLV